MMTDTDRNENTVSAEVEHAFPVSAEAVFDAWVNPQRIPAWFAPGLGPVTHAEVQPAAGGHIRITQAHEGETITHIGTFRQVVHPRRLVFSWTVEGDEGADEIVVDILSQPQGCMVRLSYRMDAEWQELCENARIAWRIMLERMAQHLAADAGSA